MTVSQTSLPRSWWTDTGIHVVTRGQGAPVVFLHGIGGNAGTFDALATVVAAHGNGTHTWDAPGYGGSADPREDEIDHVAAVMTILDSLDRPVHLVGTSWGGTLAARVALQHRTAVQTLTLVDSTRGSAVTPERRRAMQARLLDLESLGSEEFARQRAPNLVGPDAQPEHLDSVRSAMARVRAGGYAAVVGMMTATDLGPDLAFIDPPTLVLVGEHDTVTGVDESRLIADSIPGARFGLVLDAGHSAVVERPREVAAHLLQFWSFHAC